MNANELADMLLRIPAKLRDIQEAATMLRQLQAENEALKKQVIGDDFVFVCKRCGDELGIKFEEQEK